VSEAEAAAIEDLGRQMAEAIARGEFERARQLMEQAIRLRAAKAFTPDDVVLGPTRRPAE
jgi:hypothetical protein